MYFLSNYAQQEKQEKANEETEEQHLKTKRVVQMNVSSSWDSSLQTSHLAMLVATSSTGSPTRCFVRIGKGKFRSIRIATVLISIIVVLGPVMGYNLLLQEIGLVGHMSCHSLDLPQVSQGIHLLTNPNEKDEQLVKLGTDCPGQGLNPGLWICN